MKNKFLSIDTAVVLLLAVCAGLAILLGLASLELFIVAVLLICILSLIFSLNNYRIHRLVADIMKTKVGEKGSVGKALSDINMPVALISGKSIIWYNALFAEKIMNGNSSFLESIYKLIPSFDTEKVLSEKGFDFSVEDSSYTAFGSTTENGVFVIYFTENTKLKNIEIEYGKSRPVIMSIVIDTYDDILKELKAGEKVRITSEIDKIFSDFATGLNGVLIRISSSRYKVIVEKISYDKVVENKFNILDKVRNIGTETDIVTLSIGVGHSGKSFKECMDMSVSALDMALGRGGDQAAIKSPDGFEFYGGVSRSVEKQSKVKSRVIASALSDIIEQSDSVLIMGHKTSDLDSIGAAVGVLRICKIAKIPAAIVVDRNTSLAAALINNLINNGYSDDFVSPQQAQEYMTSNTLTVVVDTHIESMLESSDVYKKAKNVVVIDHHRKMVGHIENAVIFYHEPYASSASELVAELLQYTGGNDDKPTSLESEALLAGIMLDTRDFIINAGVRTFEAAAYLRRMGAITKNVKQYFTSSLKNYIAKSKLVESALIYKGCAIVTQENDGEQAPETIPQAANDLLTIQGVGASFVAVKKGDKTSISARSMGDVNVQIIMEKLGGGGHLVMAGAQLKNVSEDQTKGLIMGAIDEYRESQKVKA